MRSGKKRVVKDERQRTQNLAKAADAGVGTGARKRKINRTLAMTRIHPLPSSSVGRPSKLKMSRKCISKFTRIGLINDLDLKSRADASATTNTSFHHIGTYLSTRASSYSRSLRPTLKSAPHYTTSSTTHSSPAAPSLASSRSPHGGCHLTSATSLSSSPKRTSHTCNRHTSWMAGTSLCYHPLRLRTTSPASSLA